MMETRRLALKKKIMIEKLNEKQLIIYDRACALFEDKLTDKHEAIINKILNTPELDFVEYSDLMLKQLLNDIVFDSNLFKRCIVPPFTILDTRNGEWTSRRNLLNEYLGSSVIGRKDALTYGIKIDYFGQGGPSINNNTSQFDALLTEILYKWFGFPNCKVYDSFAGGHIRGTMARLLGYDYKGIELSPEQVEANNSRLAELAIGGDLWINDDSLNVDKYIENESVDLFLSCPPYGDLEKYTDDERDLSNMNYAQFLDTYREIIQKGVSKLKDNRFAVFVVGDFRDNKGFYRGFVKDTIIAFEDAGMGLYNEMILVNSVGSASLRAGGAFTNRKITRLHQNVLVFFKGDPDTIQDNYPEIDSELPIPQAKQSGLF